jgi:hypothetical protein
MLTLVVKFLICLLVSSVYVLVGYKITNALTDSPKWAKFEQITIWLFWPLIFAMLIFLAVIFVITSVVLSIMWAFVYVYKIAKTLINKYFRK